MPDEHAKQEKPLTGNLRGKRFRWLFYLPRPIRFFIVRRLADIWFVAEFLLFLLVDVILLAFVRRGDANAVLVVKTDSLGDYVLFRNYLQAIRAHPPYQDKRIILCANVIVQDLAETYDRDTVDEFIWVDRRTFFTHPLKRFRVLRRLKQIGIAIAINPIFCRALLDNDALVRASGAAERIGFANPPSGKLWSEKTGWINWNPLWHQKIGNRCYTRFISDPGTIFEFERNRFFFKSVLGDTPLPLRPRLDFIPVAIPELTRPFALFLPGAGERSREWSPKKYGALAQHLHEAHGLQVLVAGTKNDHEKAKQIQEAAGISIGDLTGELTLSQLIAVIYQSEIVIASDSGGIHLAAALEKRGVGISNGNNLLLFHPYPRNLCETVRYVYPPVIRAAESFEAYVARNGLVSYILASEIEVPIVIEAVDASLQKSDRKAQLSQ